MRSAPLAGGMCGDKHIFRKNGRGIFVQQSDWSNRIEMAQERSFLAR
jgi:hypothetical protein